MTCYHPLLRIELLTKPKKKAQDGHQYFSTQIIPATKLDWYLARHQFQGVTKIQTIPCKNCIGCRLDYSREWANRGYLESKLYEQNYFVTITYDDEHMITKEDFEDANGVTWQSDEWNGTLVGKHFTQFIKNVRSIMQRDFGHVGIRFMGCGEYGEENQRPHYHIILFNCPLPVETFFEPRLIHHKTYWRNKIIEKAWTKGISNITEANWNNIAYTARYITKKVNGKTSADLYNSRGQDKEFMRTSRMPGIGKGYYDLHKEEIYKNDEIIVYNSNGAVKQKPPAYFDYLYEQEQPEHFKEIQRKRQKEAQHRIRQMEINQTLDVLEQYEIEERTKQGKASQLKRLFEKKKK